MSIRSPLPRSTPLIHVRNAADVAWKPPPIDIANLLALGQKLTAPEIPSVPALCARLASYVAKLHPGTDVSAIMRWSASRYEIWSDRLALGDPTTVDATLATDPANLILGAQALQKQSLIRAQMALYERCERSGATALTRSNQTILRALLASDPSITESCALTQKLTVAELAAELSPLACATLALGQRSGDLPSDVTLDEDEIAAVTLRSVWMRDLPGVGLSLLSSLLLFGRPVPPGVIAWIARITRRDGLFGMWGLYADCHPKANLLGTVNIYWALSERSGNPAAAPRPRPRTPVNSGVDAVRCREAIAGAQSWLDAHTERFQLVPNCRDEKQYETRFKPLVELALLCHVLTRERHRVANAPWVVWAQSTAEQLFPHVEWEGLMESFRLHSSSTLGLAIYPLLTSACGKTSPFAAEAKALLESDFAQAQERTPMREMDYHFTRHCMGTSIPLDEVRKQISRTVLRIQFDPMLMDTDALYDLTHVVLYATRFGCATWCAPNSGIDVWLGESLGIMMLARLLMQDADLGAELLLVHLYTGRPLEKLTVNCIERLLAARTATGAFRGPTYGSDQRDDFDSNYHTTLVAIACLAEADLRSRDQSA